MSEEITVTTSNFQKEVMESSVPVLIDFWAEWCMPCKMIAPSLEQLAETYKGKLRVGKVNVDVESDLAARFNIISIPTLMVFKEGKSLAQKAGALPKREIENLFKGAV
ncbi:MAG: thioredoxin [Rectinemataceae bacterium]